MSYPSPPHPPYVWPVATERVARERKQSGIAAALMAASFVPGALVAEVIGTGLANLDSTGGHVPSNPVLAFVDQHTFPLICLAFMLWLVAMVWTIALLTGKRSPRPVGVNVATLVAGVLGLPVYVVVRLVLTTTS